MTKFGGKFSPFFGDKIVTDSHLKLVAWIDHQYLSAKFDDKSVINFFLKIWWCTTVVCGGSRIAEQAVGAEGSGGCGSLGRGAVVHGCERECNGPRGNAAREVGRTGPRL